MNIREQIKKKAVLCRPYDRTFDVEMVELSDVLGLLDGKLIIEEKTLQDLLENRPRLTDDKYMREEDESTVFEMFINDNQEYWEKVLKLLGFEKEET